VGQIEKWIEAQGADRSRRFEPLPGEVFVEYEFNDKSKGAYQVDASGNLQTDGLFGLGGGAIPTYLQAGKELEFQKGDKVLIDQITAEGYQRLDGTRVPPFNQTENVTEVSRRFVRQLNDYSYALQDLKTQTNNLIESINLVVANKDVTQLALDAATAQVRGRDEAIAKLTQDQQNHRKDLETIQMLFDARTRELQEVNEQIELLEKEIRNHQARITAATGSIRRRPADGSVVESSR
jgi:SMC interacting uncharacterized protein involved in chromosome segregation